MIKNWYDVIEPVNNISQGDILLNCPVFVPKYPSTDAVPLNFEDIEEEEFETDVYRANVIVLTQACDLEVRPGKAEPKLNQVLVAVLEDAREKEIGKESLKKLMKLTQSQAFLLDPSHETINIGYKVVRFDNLITFPWKLINAIANNSGPRLRLRSPYLEQLSQHFGNHFGRVAIPENREETLEGYSRLKKAYEEKRKHHDKVWRNLSEEEIVAFKNKLTE